MSHHRRSFVTFSLIVAVLLSGFLAGTPVVSNLATVHAQVLGSAAVQAPDGPELITKGSFEKGLDGWQASTLTGSAFAAAAQVPGVGAQLCSADSCHDELLTSVQLPTAAPQLFLSYRFKVVSADTSRVCNDRLYTQLRTASGAPIATVGVACNFMTNGWQYRRTEVTSTLAKNLGQTVQVVFTGSTDGSLPSGFTVDDVHLTARPMPVVHGQPIALGQRAHTSVLKGTTRLRHAKHRVAHRGKFHPMTITGPQEFVVNGGFETGVATPWTDSNAPSGGISSTVHHSGSYSYGICVGTAACQSTLAQSITLPRTPTTVTWSFSTLINPGQPQPSTPPSPGACMTPEVLLPGGGVYLPLGRSTTRPYPAITLCNTNSQWVNESFDISSAVGPYGDRTIQLAFVVNTPFSEGAPAGVYVDDVSLPVSFDVPPPGTKQLVDNSNFDTGSIFPWSINGQAPGPSHLSTSQFHSAFYSVSFCGVANTTCDDTLTQNVATPDTGFTSATMSFWVKVSTQKTSGCADTLTAKIRFGDNTSVTAATVCNQNTNGWLYQTADVSSAVQAHYNQQVQIYFEGTCPSGCAQPTTFWVDDVQLNITGTPPARWTGGNDTASGAAPWWTFVGVSPNPMMGLSVNVANGNLLASMGLTGSMGVNGLHQGVALRYNSASRGTKTDLGYGWGFDSGRDVGLDVPSTTSNIVFHDGTGYLATFVRNSNGSYTTPAGLNAQLVQTVDSTYVLTDNTSQEQLQFDTNGYLTAVQNRTGQRISYTYGYNGVANSSRDTEGHLTMLYGYASGSIYQFTDPVPRAFNIGYDTTNPVNNLSTVQVPGPNGTFRTYTLGYDGNHDLTSISDPLGNQTQITYVSNGGTFQVASIKRINATSPVNPTWTFSYGSGTTRVTDPNGYPTVYAYDSSNRVTAVTDANNHTSTTTWNSNNDVTQEQLPSGHTTTYTYSTEGRNNLIGKQLASGASESYSYADANWPYQATSVTDTQNRTTTYAYGAPGSSGAGLVTTVTDALSNQSTVAYTQDGTVSSSTSANGSATTVYYNYTNTNNPNYGVALPQTSIPPSPLGSSSVGYNVDNQPSWTSDGKGQTANYSYDELGRTTGISQQGGAGSIAYGYDAVGNQTSENDGSNTTTYGYNALYQETSKTVQTNTMPPVTTQSVTYTSDGADNLLTKQDGGGTLTYTYDAADNLASVKDPNNQTTNYTYDQDDQETSVSYPNGINMDTQYDTAGQLLQIKSYNRATPNTPITSFSYTYAIPGTTTQTTQRYTMTDTAGTQWKYSYDVLNRLTSVYQGANQTPTYSYNYDANDNMTSQTRNGITTTMAYNAVDQLCTAGLSGCASTYSYDANGNQTGQTSGNNQVYNWLDQTTSTTPNGGTAISMGYSGAGQSERTSNGSTTYQYDDIGLSSLTQSGSTTYLTAGANGELISERTGGATYYYLFDGLGSVVALTDSTGTVKNTYAYDPYGNSTAKSETVSNPLQFTSGLLDGQTGLYKMGERYYDPTIGHFNQQDPLGAGYGYVSGNPINSVDPGGMDEQGVVPNNPGGLVPGASSSFRGGMGPLENTNIDISLRSNGETAATARGRAAHRALAARARAKGWVAEKTITLNGKTIRIDVETKKGRILELKPNTKSGRKAGRRQARKYRKMTGKKVRVIYYNPW